MKSAQMMGFESPGDKKIAVSVRDWNAMKLAMWRNRVGWESAQNQAIEILERCEHVEHCPGLTSDTEPCVADKYETVDGDVQLVSKGCRDRELRMSALVILNNARQYAPIDARKLNDSTYFAPSREYFSEVLSSLGAAQIENEVLRELLRAAGVAVPEPPPNPGDHPALPAQPPVQLPPQSKEIK